MYWEVQVGSVVRIVRATEETLKRRMTEYVRRRRAAGYPLSAITFVYRPVQILDWRWAG